jgi:tripartite-type tricarboxylate transporter receptor subunit TctC
MKALLGLSAIAAAALFAPAPHAQNFPTKSILIILPQQAGSATDVMVRLTGQKMSESLKQPIVMVNLPGAGGLIGAERIANSPPDGYTIGSLNDGLLTQVPFLFQKISYDPVRGFEPVSTVATVTYALIVHPSLPAKSVGELIALAKAQPGKIDFASGGNGNAQHLAMALFMAQTGTSFTHVPFRGAAQAGLEVASGRVPVAMMGIAPNLAFIREGRLRVLAVPAEKRSSLLPDVPTVTEAGVPGYLFSTYTGFFVPRGTPKAVVALLSKETIKAVNEPTVRERLLQLGMEPWGSTPEQLGALIQNDRVKWEKVIKDAGIKAE